MKDMIVWPLPSSAINAPLPLHQAFTFSPPFSFSTSVFMHPNPQQAFYFCLLSLCLISFTLTPVILNPLYSFLLSALAPTPINIHPSSIYFYNAILICMPTRTCSSYAHLSCPLTSIAAVHCLIIPLDVSLLVSQFKILAVPKSPTLWVWICTAAAFQTSWVILQSYFQCAKNDTLSFVISHLVNAFFNSSTAKPKRNGFFCHSALFHLLSSLYNSRSLCVLDRCCDTMTECHLTRLLFSLEHTAEGLLWCFKCFCSTHSLPSSLLLSLSLPFCDRDTRL